MRICVHKAGDGGVAFYRTLQPYKWIAKNTDADVFIYEPKIHSAQRLKDEQEAADILVFQMCFGEFVQQIIADNNARIKPKKIVLEYDDYIFAVHPMNPAYRTFGCEEISIQYKDKITADNVESLFTQGKDQRKLIRGKDGSLTIEMWKDGIDGFNLHANNVRAAATKWALEKVDLITVTNGYLGKQFRKFRQKGPIAVLPNLIDFDRWLPIKDHDTEEIRLGWHGGAAHFQDLHMIRSVLWKLLDKYPKLKIAIKGVDFKNLFMPCSENNFKDYLDRVDWIPWVSDINTYPLDIRDMKVDIGICPVIDDAFNRGKSELKWLEYSALKVPTVCSPVCYPSVVHGKTGFIANSISEWEKYLTMLIESSELRKEISNKAYIRVKNFHGVDQSIAWYYALRDLLMNTQSNGIIKTSSLIKNNELVKV